MKKKLCCILTAALLAMSFCGCGPNGQEIPEETGDLRAEIEALKNAEKTENSSDAYAASLDTLLQAEEPAGALEGGRENIFLGASRAYYFKKHLMDKFQKNWDELAFVTGEGEKGQERFGQDGQGFLRNVGPAAGTDHYLTLGSEAREGGDGSRYFFSELDENRQTVKEIPLEFPEETDPDEAVTGISHFAMDGSGTVHLAQKTEDGWQYQLLSAEGELLSDYTLREGDILELVPIYEGRIAFWTGVETDREIWKNVGDDAPMQTVLRYLDPETGREKDLTTLEEGVFCWTMSDEKTLLYANRQGVYRSDLSGKSPEPLYLWVNHGISVKDIHAMQADGSKTIRMIYEDEDGCHYLCLEPSSGETADICEITLAVSSSNSKLLIPLAVEFNKKYPGCHVKIKTDPEETALLTELIAGNGPVVVDTALTGFAEQKELWEPLDSVFDQLEITDALWPAVLEAGKIDGTQYGVSMNCHLFMLQTIDPDLKDWDYDTFLQLLEQYLESHPDAEGVFNSTENYGSYFTINFFIHGIEDSYFWDAEKGTTDFDSDKFRRVLKIAKEYVEDKGNIGYDVDKLMKGKLFCYDNQLLEVFYFISDRIHYGDQLHNIGYPTKDGASNLLWSDEPLAIRKTASDEEKLAAYAFLDFCVSYEIQHKLGIMSYGVTSFTSVRRDMMETHLVDLMENEQNPGVYVDNKYIPAKDHIDLEQDSKILYEMHENAKPRLELPKELLDILEGELGQYFSGTITEDMLIDHLENRVGLYLEERK